MNNILTAYFQQQLSFCCYTSPPLFLMHYIHCFAGFVVLKPLIIIKITLHMKIDLCILMGFFVYLHLNNYFDFHVIPSENQLHFLQLYDKMSLMKVVWYVLRGKKTFRILDCLEILWTYALRILLKKCGQILWAYALRILPKDMQPNSLGICPESFAKGYVAKFFGHMP